MLHLVVYKVQRLIVCMRRLGLNKIVTFTCLSFGAKYVYIISTAKREQQEYAIAWLMLAPAHADASNHKPNQVKHYLEQKNEGKPSESTSR